MAANLAQSNTDPSQLIRYLSTNKEIVSLECGQMDPSKPSEMLLIGSETNLLVYDVHENADVFDQEVSDGLNCVAFGEMAGYDDPLVVAGGNCSIVGLDHNADEKLWTVTGDNVTAMEFLDWQNVGSLNLVVGSDDYAIRVFEGAEIIFDINEEASILQLKGIKRNVFGYALSNGTYGVYYSRKRLWKQKQSAKVTSIVGVDFEHNGQMHLVIGFDNGEIEVRSHRTGELTHKTRMTKTLGGKYPGVAKLFYYDYRM